jgi:pyruvate dehydrogenase E1 component alpha subunit
MSVSYDIDDICTASPAPRNRSRPFQVLDDDGELLPDASAPDLDDDALLSMYRDVKLARRFDERAVSLQRQGRLPNYAPMAGQVGSQVASAYAMAAQDWLFPTYREHAAKYVRGVDLATIVRSLYGYREGYDFAEDVNVLPEYVPIATQIPQAMGLAWGKQLQGEADVVALCHFGDGATSEGDFHEGMNFAGVFDAPTVFFCNNNGWAISVPRERQTASPTLAGKAAAYGFEGVRVDAMDPLAVYEVTRMAIEKARDPDPGQPRPTLIEAVGYRLGAHTTSDDPSRYRDEEEAAAWRDRAPLPRLEHYLYGRGLLDDDRKAAIEAEVDSEIAAAVDAAEALEGTEDDAADLVEHVYASVPDHLSEQAAELAAARGSTEAVGSAAAGGPESSGR